MASNGVMFLLSFVKIGQLVKKLYWEHAQTQRFQFYLATEPFGTRETFI
jgi:hypothetical protein